MAGLLAAVIQMDSQDDVEANRGRAAALIAVAADRGAKLVVLPETFVCMTDLQRIAATAEDIPGETSEMLRTCARKHGVYLVGGSFAERIPSSDKAYNTCLFYGPDGRLLSRYRKIHLFEINAPGEFVQDEATVFKHGQDIVAVETPFGVVGMSTCYDLRFPELYRALVDRGARMVAVPSAFALKTGKDHWETLIRARAIENQIYVLAAAQTGLKPDGYPKYGRSMIVDPWGTVIAQAQDTETVITAELDFDYQERIRRVLPALTNRRL